MWVSARSDVGKVRTGNEDSYCVIDLSPTWEGHFFAVADGMGGYEAGEVASALAIMAAQDKLRQLLATSEKGDKAEKPDNADKTEKPSEEEADVTLAGVPARNTLETVIRKAISHANDAILEECDRRPGCTGMGTTMTAALVGGGKLSLGHVGDSRAYLIRGGAIQQLTEDHSLVGELVRNGSLTESEAMIHPQRNILTNALGAGDDLQIDVISFDIQEGDILVLSTDGLTNLVRASEILEVVTLATEPEKVADELTGLANQRGGHDNITVVVARLA
ncbi:MAG: Stp1/IreP family PP2C-type Ser/Thr phosphatase [Actinobacteria bacterium]|nr:Stp1/IreP family PP2C-type Ser/Thr phosphatase [Actinomycetota bacterium]